MSAACVRSCGPGRRPGGFTLLEVLVALAVFAVAALMAYRGLDNVLRGRAQAMAAAEELARLQTAFMWLERDFLAVEQRPVRDPLGGRLHALIGGGQDSLVEFTRNTTAGSSGAPLLRVGYALEGGRLLRRVWPVLDRAPRSEPEAAPLLEGVSRLDLRFLGAEWESEWPPGAPDAAPLPRAVEVDLTLDSGLQVSRLLRVSG